MKKMKYIFGFLLLGILFSECSDELDLYPKDQLAAETITSGDINLLIRGVYANFREPISYYYLSFLTEDLSADNLVYRATFFQHGEVDDNSILAGNVLVARYYNGPYTIIQSANDVVNLLDESTTIPDADKNLYLGEVRMLRAYAYYRLVTLFGGVPIIETRDPDLQLIPRDTEADVWDYIIKDLVFAVNNAPDFSDPTLASKESAKALLARVYLIQGNNTEAKKLADELISNSNFELSSNYDDIWVSGSTDKEYIFYINHTINDGDAYHGYFLRHSSMPGGGRAELPVDLSLVNAYEVGDTRKAASVLNIPDAFDDPKFQWFCRKFRDSGDGSAPFLVSRIAEMYLISAEASYKISNNSADTDALGKINDVREKRGLGDLSSIDLYKIQQERRVELAFEGVRWTDMKRTPSQTSPTKSMAQVFVEANGRSKDDLLYPIPTAAIDVNDQLDQNPGY